MKNFIRDLGVVPAIKDPMEIFCDNNSVFDLSQEPGDHNISGHINIKYQFIRHQVEGGLLVVKRVS